VGISCSSLGPCAILSSPLIAPDKPILSIIALLSVCLKEPGIKARLTIERAMLLVLTKTSNISNQCNGLEENNNEQELKPASRTRPRAFHNVCDSAVLRQLRRSTQHRFLVHRPCSPATWSVPAQPDPQWRLSLELVSTDSAQNSYYFMLSPVPAATYGTRLGMGLRHRVRTFVRQLYHLAHVLGRTSGSGDRTADYDLGPAKMAAHTIIGSEVVDYVTAIDRTQACTNSPSPACQCATLRIVVP